MSHMGKFSKDIGDERQRDIDCRTLDLMLSYGLSVF
jgi:hypothetical protein